MTAKNERGRIRVSGSQYMEEPRLDLTRKGLSRETEWMATRLPFELPLTRMEERLLETPAHVPRTDVIEKYDSFKIRIDLPGADRKDVKVRVAPNLVNVSAYVQEENEAMEHEFFAKERSSEGYYRMIRLPEEVQTGTARARFVNGLLEIEVKKAKSAQATEVPIE